MNRNYQIISIVSAILIIGLGVSWLFMSKQKNTATTTNNGSTLVNNVNRSQLVNRIKLSGTTVTLDSAISLPDTSKWRNTCLLGFSCVLLPTTYTVVNGGVNFPGQVNINNNSSGELLMVLKKVTSTDTAEAVIVKEAGTVTPTFQHTSNAISGAVGNNSIYCLDDGQMRYCLLTLTSSQRYLVRGDFYSQQADQRLAFDGMVRQMLATK